MKLFVILFLIPFAVLANEDGCTESAIGISPEPGGADATITLTVLDTWTPSWAAQCLGMDVWETGSAVNVIFSSRGDMQINSLDPVSGTSAGTIDLDGGNTNCFGVAWNNDLTTPIYHTDDWSDNVLYYTEDYGTSWSTVSNPAASQGRGMDFDGTDYWISNSSSGVIRFTPGGSSEAISLPEAPSQLSGVTVFPYLGDIGLCVTTYNNHFFYFYVWDGSTATYLGNAACPTGCSSSYGLAYSDDRGTIFWSYNSGGYRISEVDFVIDVALDRMTWGEIKATF
jgi:hypothetical protein